MTKARQPEEDTSVWTPSRMVSPSANAVIAGGAVFWRDDLPVAEHVCFIFFDDLNV